ncbi:YbhB/YbcL family Raf kinase inhibitor-like protein [Actinoplanes sp. CA-030573]|uniref:YbhB/YbcL family Raf kinase inhibitor-like protein n=1 Tax=Actinoplanes sp. CA-030573 TaxID=3239898 RepID=UPI003D9094DE
MDRRALLAAGAALLVVTATGCGDSHPSPPAPPAASKLMVTSTAFTDGGVIPAEFTCAGAGHRPPLRWSGATAPAYAIVVLDPDAPGGDYYHWVVVDLPESATEAGDTLPSPARQLDNSAGHPEWTPPCPPSGTHHYQFTVYALSESTNATSVGDAFDAITKTTTAQGTLTGIVTH